MRPPVGTSRSFRPTPELGADRNAVVRLMITDRPEGSARDAIQRVLIGDPASAGYEAFRAGIAEYVALLPPNSHGEANPADKDPVPPPFDNTYNSPEHDAFVLKVKYQRNDSFFTANLVDGPIAPGSIRRGTISSARGRTTMPTSICWPITTA